MKSSHHHFLSLSILGQVATPSPSPSHLSNQHAHYSGVEEGLRNVEENFYPGLLDLIARPHGCQSSRLRHYPKDASTRGWKQVQRSRKYVNKPGCINTCAMMKALTTFRSA